jgi:hypothetical protein
LTAKSNLNLTVGNTNIKVITLDFPILDNGDESILKNDEYKNDEIWI